MIEPTLKNERFLADVRSAEDHPDVFHLWWLGQSGFLLKWNGRRILFDPYLSDSLTKKYAQTDKPHVRMTARVVAPQKLDSIQAVTSSHSHTDHLDAETLRPLMAANPGLRILVPEAERAWAARRLEVDPGALLGLDAGTSVDLAGMRFHAVPAAHESAEKDEQGRYRFLGYVTEFGSWTLYHSGDTVRYPGMTKILRRWRIDVAILPVNGRSPERRVPGNLSGPEAAALAHEIEARLVIPCHYEMFEFNTASPEDFVRKARELGQAFRVLRAGERFSSDSV